MKRIKTYIASSLLGIAASAQNHRFTLEDFPTKTVHIIAIQGESIEIEVQEN